LDYDFTGPQCSRRWNNVRRERNSREKERVEQKLLEQPSNEHEEDQFLEIDKIIFLQNTLLESVTVQERG